MPDPILLFYLVILYCLKNILKGWITIWIVTNIHYLTQVLQWYSANVFLPPILTISPFILFDPSPSCYDPWMTWPHFFHNNSWLSVLHPLHCLYITLISFLFFIFALYCEKSPKKWSICNKWIKVGIAHLISPWVSAHVSWSR